MNFSVFGNLNNQEALQIARELAAELSASDCKLFFSDEYEGAVSGSVCRFIPHEDLLSECDIAVAIGGDGTTVKTAKNAAFYNKKTLGINGGRLGFLSGIERNELSLLKEVLNGNYSVEERTMLRAEVLENDEIIAEYHCLNDAVFSRGDFARLIDIFVTIEGRELLSTRADGVIISTSTGSTAYSLAAGGPVLSPDLDCVVVTSICPHSLMERSIVVNSKSALKVKISSDVSNNAILNCDGEEPIIISDSSVVSVSQSEYKARLIKIKPDNFYEIVKKKIIERRA